MWIAGVKGEHVEIRLFAEAFNGRCRITLMGVASGKDFIYPGLYIGGVFRIISLYFLNTLRGYPKRICIVIKNAVRICYNFNDDVILIVYRIARVIPVAKGEVFV